MSPFFLLICLTIWVSAAVHGQVAGKNTFKSVNQGFFVEEIGVDNGARIRFASHSGGPFGLCWYTTVAGRYHLGLFLGFSSQTTESSLRLTWTANRNLPVGENATLAFGRDGNLVLAEADGRVVWSTGTANKGAVGFEILPTGNMVIYGRNGRFLWQSFDHPTDTLLVGQSLYVGGPTKLVSRRSATDDAEGGYSLALGRNGLNLYISSYSLRYSSDRFTLNAAITNVTFEGSFVNGGAAYDLSLSTDSGSFAVARPKYNATLSLLRLEPDGNLVVHTFYDQVDYSPWERTHAFFSEDGALSGCGLPGKCGALGVCKKEMCVACPTAAGLLGWSESCRPPALGGRCRSGAGYFKVAGVESFISSYNTGLGKTRVEECRRRCSKDCKCLGFFYWEESSECWLAPALGSLSSPANASHVAYIKMA